jgi:hypothetical protein
MALLDSVDKIVTRYFSVVTSEKFTYKGVTYLPKLLRVSPLLFRDYTCPKGCGACCPRFSLDYLPEETHPYKLEPRQISFNGKSIQIFSDVQTDHKNYHCRNLSQKDGRCGIHGKQPFSCDFELIRALSFADEKDPNTLTQKLFGRGWAMKRIDGVRGTLCEMTPVTDKSIQEVLRKMERLKQWSDHFQLETKCSQIISWIRKIQQPKSTFFGTERNIKPVLF